jgi:hypothetical protein
VSVLNAFLSTWSSATIMRSVLRCCGSLTILTLLTGFDRTVATKSADGDQDLFGSNLRPDEDTGPVSRAAVGNNRFLIKSLTRSGQTVIALCNYRSDTD